MDRQAGDMKYHTGCMITNVDKVLSTDDEKKPEILIDDGRVHAAQQEIVMEVENGISRGGPNYLLRQLYPHWTGLERK